MNSEVDVSDEVYPGLGRDEYIGYLSPEEAARINEKELMTFKVTVTTATGTWHTVIHAIDSCAAVVNVANALNLGLYGRPKSIKIKVDPISANESGSEG